MKNKTRTHFLSLLSQCDLDEERTVYGVSHEFMNIWPWNRQPTLAIEASDITQGVEPSQSMKETQRTNP
jgi:hypothetical protein